MSMKRQYGFSLLEALVSMLIIMFGLLCIAGMQMLAINNTETARYNAMAAMFASNMAAKMQGNKAYWGTPPSSVTVNGSTVTGGPPSTSADCVASYCAPAVLAYYDLKNWGLSLLGSVNGTQAAQGLPGGNAKITCSAASSPPVCTLNIFWTEKNVALTTPTTATKPATGPFASSTASTFDYKTLVSIQP
jgi:type IV pilus assembly protein PilV